MAYMPAVLVAAGIAVLSLWENPQLPKEVAGRDGVLHGLMYCALALSLMAPVSKRWPSRALPYVYVWLASTAYGALMEVLQRYCTLTRTGAMDDIYANLTGALLGVLLIAVWRIKFTK